MLLVSNNNLSKLNQCANPRSNPQLAPPSCINLFRLHPVWPEEDVEIKRDVLNENGEELFCFGFAPPRPESMPPEESMEA